MNNILYENNTLSLAARYMLLIISASYGVPSVKLFHGQIEFYMSDADIHLRCIQKCMRYAQIDLQYGQFYMSYAYFH